MSGKNKMTQAKMIVADICAQLGDADQFRVALEEHLATWGPHCGAPMGVYVGQLRVLLRAARIAEGLACAKIAKAIADLPDGSGCGCGEAEVIAAKILARGAK